MSGIIANKGAKFGANRSLGATSGTLYEDILSSVTGLVPQYGMSYSELIAFITSSSNNRLVAPPPSLLSACNQILRTDQLCAVFNNTPHTVRVAMYPNFYDFNPCYQGGDQNIEPFAVFDLTTQNPKMFVDVSATFSLVAYACQVRNGENTSGTRETKPIPLDPMAANSYHIVSLYDRFGNWTGIDLVPSQPSMNGNRTITVVATHESIQVMFILYRGANIVTQWIMADTEPVEICKLIPCGFDVCFQNQQDTGGMVSELQTQLAYPGQAVFFTQENNRDPNIVSANSIALNLVFRPPSNQEIRTAAALSKIVPGGVNWSTKSDRTPLQY